MTHATHHQLRDGLPASGGSPSGHIQIHKDLRWVFDTSEATISTLVGLDNFHIVPEPIGLHTIGLERSVVDEASKPRNHHQLIPKRSNINQIKQTFKMVCSLFWYPVLQIYADRIHCEDS